MRWRDRRLPCASRGPAVPRSHRRQPSVPRRFRSSSSCPRHSAPAGRSTRRALPRGPGHPPRPHHHTPSAARATAAMGRFHRWIRLALRQIASPSRFTLSPKTKAKPWLPSTCTAWVSARNECPGVGCINMFLKGHCFTGFGKFIPSRLCIKARLHRPRKRPLRSSDKRQGTTSVVPQTQQNKCRALAPEAAFRLP